MKERAVCVSQINLAYLPECETPAACNKSIPEKLAVKDERKSDSEDVQIPPYTSLTDFSKMKDNTEFYTPKDRKSRRGKQ